MNKPLKPWVHASTNLSHLWLEVLAEASRSPGGEIRPMVASLSGFDAQNLPKEDENIRNALDKFLYKEGKWSVEIVAFTIFPQRYLQVCDGDRHALYEMYMDALPHIKARNPQLNGRGLYFERMIKFGSGKYDDNQLEFAISEYLAGRTRTSKFQASIYDPFRDQSRQPYQSFPCLQSVSFVPTKTGLVLNGFYAMQYAVQKAYGNFLGLAHLGAFVAGAMKMPLAQVNIIAGVEKLEFSKTKVKHLLARLPETAHS